MQRITRRRAIQSVGITAGTGLLGGCHGRSHADPQPDGRQDAQTTAEQARAAPAEWTYVELDPDGIAAVAYDMYPQGSCMYALVGSIVGALAEKLGEPFRSFPLAMMRYGHGGVGGWGSICGAANGAAAVIGLLFPEEEKTRRDRMIAEVFSWYENTALPRYQPAAPAKDLQILPSRADSLLCHLSVGRWCETSGLDAFCEERKERCRRLTADVAEKTVEVLNRELAGQCPQAKFDPEVKSCIECHGQQELGDSVGRMRCSACHQFSKKHP